MPGRLFEIRYPNGDFEMSAFTQQRPPEIGETLRRRGSCGGSWARRTTSRSSCESNPYPIGGKPKSQAE